MLDQSAAAPGPRRAQEADQGPSRAGRGAAPRRPRAVGRPRGDGRRKSGWRNNGRWMRTRRTKGFPTRPRGGARRRGAGGARRGGGRPAARPAVRTREGARGQCRGGGEDQPDRRGRGRKGARCAEPSPPAARTRRFARLARHASGSFQRGAPAPARSGPRAPIDAASPTLPPRPECRRRPPRGCLKDRQRKRAGAFSSSVPPPLQAAGRRRSGRCSARARHGSRLRYP